MTPSCALCVHAALVGFESNNKYEIRNAMGQNVFYAVEENDCLNRQCCGPMRPFTIHVLDNFGQEVITVTRPLKCMSCFFPCCLQEVSTCSLRFLEITVFEMVFVHRVYYCLRLMSSSFTCSSRTQSLVRAWHKSHSVLSQSPTQLEVQSPPGNTVGYVVQQWHPFSPKFLVGNEHSEPVLKIHGPFCGWSCLPDVDFEVGLSKHRNPLNWGKHNTEMLTFTSSGHFLVKDPPRALKQEICFQSELARMKPLQRARSCVAQCGYCSTAQLVLLNWGGKGIWVSDTDLLPDPEDG